MNSMFVILLPITTFLLHCPLVICRLFIGRFQAFQVFCTRDGVLGLYFCKMIKDFAKNRLSLADFF